MAAPRAIPVPAEAALMDFGHPVVLLAANTIALLVYATLVGVKVWRRAWREPRERSLLIVAVSVFMMAVAGMFRRAGADPALTDALVGFAWTCIGAAGAHRIGVMLTEIWRSDRSPG